MCHCGGQQQKTTKIMLPKWALFYQYMKMLYIEWIFKLLTANVLWVSTEHYLKSRSVIQTITRVKYRVQHILINEQCLKASYFPALILSVVISQSPSPRPSSALLQFYTNHPLNIWECHLLLLMETSVPDTAAIPYGNLAALYFPNQLAKKGGGGGKTWFPMQIYAPLPSIFFFSDPVRKATFPNRNWNLKPLMPMKFVIGDVQYK